MSSVVGVPEMLASQIILHLNQVLTVFTKSIVKLGSRNIRCDTVAPGLLKQNDCRPWRDVVNTWIRNILRELESQKMWQIVACF